MEKSDASIGDRVRLVRKGKELNQTDFGVKVFDDIQPGSAQKKVNRIETGIQDLTATEAASIAEKMEVSLYWLITGRDPVKSIEDPEDEFDYVPMATAKLNAGGGSVVLSENFKGRYAFRKKWIRWVANGVDNLILMQVEGDSMEPTIQHGDTVMIDRSRTSIVSGALFAIGIEDCIAIKRLEILHGGLVRVISDNRDVYPHTEIPLGEIRIIGRVLWYARQLVISES